MRRMLLRRGCRWASLRRGGPGHRLELAQQRALVREFGLGLLRARSRRRANDSRDTYC